MNGKDERSAPQFLEWASERQGGLGRRVVARSAGLGPFRALTGADSDYFLFLCRSQPHPLLIQRRQNNLESLTRRPRRPRFELISCAIFSRRLIALESAKALLTD